MFLAYARARARANERIIFFFRDKVRSTGAFTEAITAEEARLSSD